MPCFLRFGKALSLSDGLRDNFNLLDVRGTAAFSGILQTESACNDGGVEGGVSSSSDDEADSIPEDVSETREGVRDTVCEGTSHPGSVGDCRDEEVTCGRRGRGIVFLLVTTGFKVEGPDVSAGSCAGGFERTPDTPDDACIDGAHDAALREDTALNEERPVADECGLKEVGLLARGVGNGAILRLRGPRVRFAVEVSPGWGWQQGLDASTTIGDKSGGRGFDLLDFGIRGRLLEGT